MSYYSEDYYDGYSHGYHDARKRQGIPKLQFFVGAAIGIIATVIASAWLL